MAYLYTGEFPSDQQFGTERGKQLPNGDELRRVIGTFPVVRLALLAPGAEAFAHRARIRMGDVQTLASRAGETGMEGFYRAATGLRVTPHTGHVVALPEGEGATGLLTPMGDPLSDICVTTPEARRNLAERLSEGRTRDEMLALAAAIIEQARQPR